jgi:hypothetical protein
MRIAPFKMTLLQICLELILIQFTLYTLFSLSLSGSVVHTRPPKFQTHININPLFYRQCVKLPVLANLNSVDLTTTLQIQKKKRKKKLHFSFLGYLGSL